MTEKTTLAEARLKASLLLPYMTSQVMTLQPVARPGLGTMAVDQHCRLYYDPDWLATRTIEDAGFIVLHEALHILMRHAQRSRARFGERISPRQARLWNYAGDATINEALAESDLRAPQDAITPGKLGLDAHLSTDEYYALLDQQAESQEGSQDHAEGQQGERQGDGEPSEGSWPSEAGGDGEPYNGTLRPDAASGVAGSGSDGVPKPWECPAPDQCPDVPGLSEHEQEGVARAVAKAIQEHAKGRGTVPGALRRFARDILHPKADPVRELLAKCKYALSSVHGFGNFTYRKPHRRTPRGLGVVLPSHVQPVPRVTIIADTSGSMGDDDLALALGVIAQVVKALPDQRGVRVLAGDTTVAKAQRVFRADQVELAGGGGTDMGRLVRQAAEERPRPDVVLVATDGETPWCDEIPGLKVVACLTRPQDESAYFQVPAWIETVYLHEEA